MTLSPSEAARRGLDALERGDHDEARARLSTSVPVLLNSASQAARRAQSARKYRLGPLQRTINAVHEQYGIETPKALIDWLIRTAAMDRMSDRPMPRDDARLCVLPGNAIEVMCDGRAWPLPAIPTEAYTLEPDDRADQSLAMFWPVPVGDPDYRVKRSWVYWRTHGRPWDLMRVADLGTYLQRARKTHARTDLQIPDTAARSA